MQYVGKEWLHAGGCRCLLPPSTWISVESRGCFAFHGPSSGWRLTAGLRGPRTDRLEHLFLEHSTQIKGVGNEQIGVCEFPTINNLLSDKSGQFLIEHHHEIDPSGADFTPSADVCALLDAGKRLRFPFVHTSNNTNTRVRILLKELQLLDLLQILYFYFIPSFFCLYKFNSN